MKIQKTAILHFHKDGGSAPFVEGLKHVKILPYLSVVQSVHGSYDITLGGGKREQTGEGGFFVAPAGVRQTIVHHVNTELGCMECRWLFLDVQINYGERPQDLYELPTVIRGEARRELGILFDRLFSTDDPWSNFGCAYEIFGLLLRLSTPAYRRQTRGVRDAVAYITRNYSEPIRIQDLAREAHTSESNLYASFKAQLGTSPIAYLNDYRLSLAANLLEESDARIGEIADSVGIEDSLYFSRLFKRTYGTSPIEYRKMHSKKSDSKDCKE